MKRIFAAIIAGWVCSCSLHGQQPGAEEILARLERSYDTLEDYSTTAQADVNMERLRVPRMNATIYFKQPDKIHLESESFAMLPRDGVGFNPLMYTKNYTGRIEGIDTVDGVPTTKIFLTRKTDAGRLRQLTIWVDLQRWVVVRMETVPYQGRQITLAIEYTKIENTWWLPSKIVVTLDVQQPSDREQQSRKSEMQSPTGRTQLPRKGTITVTYSNYKVNQHLSNELFEKKNTEKKK